MGADVVGVDWRVPLEVARERVGPGVALQGNLDPAPVRGGMGCRAPPPPTASWPQARPRAATSSTWGHGVLPETDPAVLERLTDHVHAYRRPLPKQPD